MTIEIQKKPKPVILLSIFIFAVCAAAIWALVGYIFPRLPGFLDLKYSAAGGIAAIGIVAIYLLLTQNPKGKPGLIIDEQGLTDHSNAASVGLIPWQDISAVWEERDIFRRKLIVVSVKDPDAYIDKTERLRESRKSQYDQYGSPIVIATGGLQFDPQELVAMLQARSRRA